MVPRARGYSEQGGLGGCSITYVYGMCSKAEWQNRQAEAEYDTQPNILQTVLTILLLV